MARSNEHQMELAHELRTPITAILGYTNLLVEQHAGSADSLEKLLVIRNHSEYLLKLVNHLLTDPAAGLPGRRQPLDPVAVAMDVVQLMQPVARRKGLELSVRPEGPMPETIPSDEMRLRQVLINLLGNAVKFTNEGYIRLRLRADGGHFQMAVEDTGVGMDEAQQRQLFQPFVQVHVTSRRRGGTGLGLSTCQRLARQLGGEISCSSQRGQGTTFTLRLPLPEAVPLRVHPLPTPRGGSLLGHELLLAATAGDSLLLTSAVLKKEDASITLTADAETTVDKAMGSQRSGRTFAAVLLDDSVPDFLALARHLRALGYRGRILSLGPDSPAHRRMCLEAGMDGVLPKPVAVPSLLQALSQGSAEPSESTP